MDFSGKTVLITGATGLIGSTLAETISQAGAEVVSAVRDISGPGAGRGLRRGQTPEF